MKHFYLTYVLPISISIVISAFGLWTIVGILINAIQNK